MKIKNVGRDRFCLRVLRRREERGLERKEGANGRIYDIERGKLWGFIFS